MGAENSKNESRESPPGSPSLIHQRILVNSGSSSESPYSGNDSDRSRPTVVPRSQASPRSYVGPGYPGYTQYPSIPQNPTPQAAPRNPASQSHPALERTRSPYSYTNQELYEGVRKDNSPSNLYPNLNENRPSTPVQKVETPVNSRNSTAYYNSPNGQGGKSGTGDYVVVNFDQPRSYPKPSAPPASEVTAEPYLRPPLHSGSRISSPASTSANTSAQNTNHVSRGRATDDKYNCPTCSQHLGTAIYQCRTGHGSCQDCHRANRVCGKCSAPLTNTRNIMLEGLIAEHLLSNKTVCPNPGCTLNFNYLDMKNHINECPFGETDCPMGKFFGQCSCRYKIEDIMSHFDAFHKEQRMADVGKEMFLFNICMETHKIYVVKIGPYNFIVHVKVSEANRNIYIAVQLFGTVISATKWTYEVHVYNKRQPRRKFQYSDSCLSISTSVDEIFKESNCATLPLTYATTLVNESSLTYKFFIKKTEGKWRERNKGKWKNQRNE